MPAIGDGPSDYFCDRFRAWILQVREPSGLCPSAPSPPPYDSRDSPLPVY